MGANACRDGRSGCRRRARRRRGPPTPHHRACTSGRSRGERLSRQAELCNAVLVWLRERTGWGVRAREGRTCRPAGDPTRGSGAWPRRSVLPHATPYPLVPLSSADLLVNARGEPSVGGRSSARFIRPTALTCCAPSFVGTVSGSFVPALEAHRVPAAASRHHHRVHRVYGAPCARLARLDRR